MVCILQFVSSPDILLLHILKRKCQYTLMLLGIVDQLSDVALRPLLVHNMHTCGF